MYHYLTGYIAGKSRTLKDTLSWRTIINQTKDVEILLKLQGVPENLTHLVSGLLRLFYGLIWANTYDKWKLNYKGKKWVLIVFPKLNITGDMDKDIFASNKKMKNTPSNNALLTMITIHFFTYFWWINVIKIFHNSKYLINMTRQYYPMITIPDL